MSQSVIKVEGLSKQFLLAHESQEKYSTLRDAVTHGVKKYFSKDSQASSHGKSIETFWALKDVSFEINKGDRIGVIGRNGAGKSTLLKVLSRITEPTHGRISLKGRVASLLEVGTGFHPELTGRENIYLNGAILGMSRLEIKKKFDEIVDFAETERFLDTPVKRYSSGMYVRLAFAIAAHLEPEILIIDEVLAVGDIQFQRKCLGKMEDVSKNDGRTILFVSHNMGVVTQLCTSCIYLNQGKVEGIGSVDEMVNKYINKAQDQLSNVYQADDSVRSKKNYFTKIMTINNEGKVSSDFLFDEEITIDFSFTINEADANLLIGIGFQDKFQNRVCTILKEVSFFEKQEDGSYRGKVTLPPETFAPNIYSFVCVIWLRNVVVYDNLENVCSVKIHDNGSSLAAYEGADYGSVIIKPKWSNG